MCQKYSSPHINFGLKIFSHQRWINPEKILAQRPQSYLHFLKTKVSFFLTTSIFHQKIKSILLIKNQKFRRIFFFQLSKKTTKSQQKKNQINIPSKHHLNNSSMINFHIETTWFISSSLSFLYITITIKYRLNVLLLLTYPSPYSFMLTDLIQAKPKIFAEQIIFFTFKQLVYFQKKKKARTWSIMRNSAKQSEK